MREIKTPINRAVKRRFIIWLFVFGLIAILIAFIVMSKLMFDVGIVCIFHEMLGIYCPGCGGTRMAVEIIRGNFYQAFRYNMFIFLTFPILFVIFLKQSYMYIMHNKLILWLDKFLIWYAIGLVIFGVLRNIEMFKWMAPV